MSKSPHIESLPNGLTLIIEQIPHLESAAYSLLIPTGLTSDSEDRIGLSLILAELTSRGAGTLDVRGLSDAFDDLGIRHGEGAGLETTSYGGALIADKLPEALKLVSLMVREATLPAEEIDGIKSLLIQDIASLADNPARRVMVELGKRYFPDPYGRPGIGTLEGIKETTRSELEQAYRQRFSPKGAILSVAGRIDKDNILRVASQLFGSWKGNEAVRPAFGNIQPHAAHHIQAEAAQLQIALAFPSVEWGSPDYYVARVCNGLLSGGMFGRLFIEVREKRGLCYSVYSSVSATRNAGTVYLYAGTTPERAQETLDVMLAELLRVKGTIQDEELARAKANMKASLVMAEESSSSRASSNATDWWLGSRVRSLDEIQSGIDAVSAADIDRYVAQYFGGPKTLITLGSRQLKFGER